MTTIIKLKRFWCILLVFPAFILTSLAAQNPEVTEYIYSTWIFHELSGLLGRISGILPFSLAEFIVILLPLSLIFYIILMLRKIIKYADSRRDNTVKLTATLLCLIGVIYFGFTVLCGLNYQRLSFSVASGLDVRPSSAEELTALCDELAATANYYADKVERDSDGVMVSSFSSYYNETACAAKAYDEIGNRYPVLAGYCPRPKPVIFSKAMSMAGLVGVYFPFTFEANVNIDVPDYCIPSGMLHELAHYKGFMREDEANFISYIACVSCGNDDFAYSGTMLALIHSINALYSSDKDAYWVVKDKIDERIFTDFNANDAYWKQFEGPISEASEIVNDVYLKTNRQPAGVKSYGQMVDLLLAEYRQRHGQ